MDETAPRAVARFHHHRLTVSHAHPLEADADIRNLSDSTGPGFSFIAVREEGSEYTPPTRLDSPEK